MKIGKRIAIILCVYVGIVVMFETLIGVIQPASGETLVITTADPDGSTNDRVLARLDSDDKLYVAANHWPRAWYNQALENPEVEVTLESEKQPYLAVPISGAEAERVATEHDNGVIFAILTGFPKRLFLRLDPR